jgi:signal transduction histidine kinase
MSILNSHPPDVERSKLMHRQKRVVVRVSLYIGTPLLCAMATYNFINGNLFLALLSCTMLLIVILLGFVIRRRIDEEFEYKIYSILFRLFIASVGIALLYEIGPQSNFSRIEWCYLFPLLVFFVVRTGEGIIWMSVFYGMIAFLILHFDLQQITLFQLQELRYRFLISLFVACVLSLLLEHGFRHAQQRLLNHQRNLKESENRYRQAYEQLNAQMQERKQVEEALRKKTDELARSNRDLEQFAYVASHDLQEPLRMVTSYVQLLARRYKGKLGSDADDFIGFAEAGAIRMWKLIHALLTYSRVGMRVNQLELTDCEAILSQSLNNLKVAIEENGAVVTHDSLPTVMADNSQLVQLFQNLVGNAIKFRGREPPRVHISAGPNGNSWIFSVRDNGIGIAPEYVERIFVIFQRLHGREEYPGTGIGLAICQKIVERHGGHIWVESQVGEGATFYFTLPKERELQT